MNSEFPIPHEFRPLIQDIVHQLATQNYEQLVADGRAGGFTAEILKEVIERYGRTLTELPEETWDCVYSAAYASENGRFGLEAFDVALWTLEEGYSDLTLKLDAHEENGTTKLSIRDILVL